MTCKIECVRCQQLLPCSAKLPLVCSCGHRHFDSSELRQVDAPLGLVQKAVKAATAFTKWVEAGRPVRSADEVAAIGEICESCPLFSANTCGACGCNLPQKIPMATEHCPLDPPRW